MTRRAVQPPPQQQPPPPAETGPPPRLPWAAPGAGSEEPVTLRMRREVRDLPGWDPLPPGEIYVQRNRDR